MHVSRRVGSQLIRMTSDADLVERYCFGERARVCIHVAHLSCCTLTMLKLKLVVSRYATAGSWRDELFQSPQAADYRAVTLKGNKKPLLLIASVCFLDPPNELPRHGQRVEEGDGRGVETQFQSAKTTKTSLLSSRRSLSEERIAP